MINNALTVEDLDLIDKSQINLQKNIKTYGNFSAQKVERI